ncbi:putative reverse transcriptase domain-containing protein [Tanacetum coccineum]
MILAAQSEAFKQENVLVEMLHGLDQQMERKEDESLYFIDRIWVPLVGGVRTIIMDEAHKTRLTKSAHFLATREDYSTERLAKLYIDEIVAQHGVPVSIISDQDGRGNWDVHLPIAEFSYNYSYHSSIRCAPFEALYGRKCRSPVLWVEISESSLIRPELVQETTDKVVLIKEKLKAARDLQKSYTDNRHKPLEFEVGDRVLLKILEMIGPVAYRLRLPEELSSVHDTFHVSNLKTCLADANLHVPLDEIKIDTTLRFVEEPVEIMDRELVKSQDEISLRRGYCDTHDFSREMMTCLYALLRQFVKDYMLDKYGKYRILEMNWVREI